MKAKELRELSGEELSAKVGEMRHELFNARIKKTTGQLENTAKLRTLRRDIARAETVLGERRGAK
jgi:large subunit ribosomal protein L29